MIVIAKNSLIHDCDYDWDFNSKVHDHDHENNLAMFPCILV